MKNFLSTLCIITLAFLTSCQKPSKDNTPVTSASNKIKTYTEDITSPGQHTRDSFSISYNAGGLISLKQSIFNPGNKIIYTYGQDNTFTEDSYNSNNLLNFHSVFYLKNNLIDSFTELNNGNFITYKLIYNNLNLLSKETDYIFHNQSGPPEINSTDFFYDANGNEIKEITSQGITREKSYYLNETNNIDFLYPYIKSTPNLLKNVTITANGGTGTFTHLYNFDDLHRVILDSTYISENNKLKYSYTY